MKIMHYIFRTFVLLLFFCITTCVEAQVKRALLVGISDYSKDYSWSRINGANDVDLIKSALKGFTIKELRNTEATYGNICQNLSNLVNQSKKGDIIYIHLSGHGQPVEDFDGDEDDGWDESFVPYDAGFKYGEKGYTGNHHLIDDNINQYISKLREKVGHKGFVYLVVDACHSGTMQRGDDESPEIYNDAPLRGTNSGFSKNKIYKPKRDAKQKRHYRIPKTLGSSDVIVLEACASNQKNQEIKIVDKYYGPLTYSIYSIIKKKGLGRTLKWCNAVSQVMDVQMKKTMSNQTMIVETSINE